jgi:hypothetical protein
LFIAVVDLVALRNELPDANLVLEVVDGDAVIAG